MPPRFGNFKAGLGLAMYAIDIIEDSEMADAMEAVRQLGQAMLENMNRQMDYMREREEASAERAREREDANAERYRDLVEGQQRFHREDTETLASQFERLRLEKEQARGRQTQRLPNYDGINLEVDEWQEKVEAVAKCNDWDLSKLLEALPTSLAGQAKRSFDSLTDGDKGTMETFFQSMREKLDPQAERKNKELFMLARRAPSESIMSYIDRCRMYIRRWGGDPKEGFAIEMLKYKVLDCLTPTDRKILNATIDSNEELDKIILKADAMTTTPKAVIGAVMGEGQNQWGMGSGNGMDSGNENGRNVQTRFPQGFGRGEEGQGQPLRCWKCGRFGHRRSECRVNRQPQYYNNYGPMNRNENVGWPPRGYQGNQVRGPPLQDITQRVNNQVGGQNDGPRTPASRLNLENVEGRQCSGVPNQGQGEEAAQPAHHLNSAAPLS